LETQVSTPIDCGSPTASTIRQDGRGGGPIRYWAAFGAFCLALQAYVYARWVTSDSFRAVKPGPDPVPHSEKVWAWIIQISLTAVAVAAFVWVVRRCLRERRLTFDAKLMIGWYSIYWLDPVPNFLRPQVLFNSYYVNRGSWVEYIPGWISPNGRYLPNALFFEGSAYGIMILTSVLGCGLMRKVKQRHPQIGGLGLLATCWVFYAAFIIVVEEVVMIRSGWLSWNGTIHGLSLWGGTKHQLPLTEVLFFGITCTSITALRYFRDDRGRSIVERGEGRRAVTPRRRTALSLLAVVGFANCAMVLYNVATVPMALYVGPSPKGYPSYMRNGMCGEGTPYECPGPRVPIILPAGRPPG
jgi:hypothetical protein